MDSETTRVVVTVAASSATAICVAGTGLVGTFMSQARAHRRQLDADERRHQREIAAEGNRATRSREEAAAEECDRAISVLVREEIARFNEGRATPSDEMSQRRGSIRAAEDTIGAHSAYLPEGLRDRLVFLRDVIRWAEDLDRGGHHPSSRYSIVNDASARAHSEIARFMRREPVQPTWIDPLLIEYEYALEDLYEERRSEFAHEIAEDEDARSEWLERNPEVRERLDAAVAKRAAAAGNDAHPGAGR